MNKTILYEQYKTIQFVSLICLSFALIIGCTKSEFEKKQIKPKINENKIQTSKIELSSIESLENEIIQFNQRIIDFNVNIDSLQFYYFNGNTDRINSLLGYDNITVNQKLIFYTNLAQRLASDYSLVYPSNTSMPLSNSMFEKLKTMKTNQIADVFAPKGGGHRPTVCRQPAYSACLAAAFIGGIGTSGILGSIGCYLCYCDLCTESNVDKFCGASEIGQPSVKN